MANWAVPQPAGVVTVHAFAPFGQHAPLPSVLKQTLAVQVEPLPRKALRPKLLIESPHPEAVVSEHVPVFVQQAPVMQGLVEQVVPTPPKVWLEVAGVAQPTMVLIEQTPAVVQQDPVSWEQGLEAQAVSLPR